MKQIFIILFSLVFLPMILYAQDQAPVLRAKSDRGTVTITPLTINSEEDDFAPFYLPLNNQLYFSSERTGNQRIYVSTGLSRPERVRGDINDATHSGAASLTFDGQMMYFSAYEHDISAVGRTDIYVASKDGGDWNVENLGTVNSPYWDSQPWISPDGQWLFFVSDRPGGFGGTDIYFCKKLPNGQWSGARNAGNTINTQYNEMAPSLAPDNQTFYFASDRPGGYGGYDIYRATFQNGNFVNAAQNIGPEINTSANELFYVAVPNSEIAYFSSDRANGSGKFDLYSAIPNPSPPDPVQVVRGTVRDRNTKDPLGAKIIITDIQTGTVLSQFFSDPVTGEYYVVLPRGKDYSITASSPGYLFYSERFNVPQNAPGKETIYNIELSPITGGYTRLLIFFEFDKADLRPESIAELNRVIDFLRANPSVRIRIEGHTDDVGDEQYNLKLSQRRADAVRNYLIQHDIDPKRIEAVGYGESRPLVPNTSDEARAKNRRVEMHIIE